MRSESPARTSSATRWARSTCSSTPHRNPRCCLPRSLTMICGGGEIQRNEHSAALYDYDATLPGMKRIVEALFSDPAYPERRRVRDAALRVQHRARRVGGVGRSQVPTAGPGAAATSVEQAGLRTYRRADAGGRGRAATNCCPVAGRPRSPSRSRTAARPSSNGPATARRSNSPTPSTNCCWIFSAT